MNSLLNCIKLRVCFILNKRGFNFVWLTSLPECKVCFGSYSVNSNNVEVK